MADPTRDDLYLAAIEARLSNMEHELSEIGRRMVRINDQLTEIIATLGQ